MVLIQVIEIEHDKSIGKKNTFLILYCIKWNENIYLPGFGIPFFLIILVFSSFFFFLPPYFSL